jgi:hypothetical protein
MTRNASFPAALVGALVFALGLSACGKDGYKEKTLTLQERETNFFGFNDAAPKTKVGKEGPEKLSPGDVLSFTSDMLDKSKKKVGELNANCIVTRPGTFNIAHVQCTGTFGAPGGSLSVTVGGRFTDKVSGPITGGTGDYQGAGGTFASSGGDNATDTFKLRIPQK